MAADALDIEIFATGTWGGHEWTAEHLDAMVANFGALGKHIKPPVKLGHNEKQVLADQPDGQPALGWVQSLKRQGEKLIASVADMPQLLRNMIASKRYARVSAELYPKWEGTSWEENLKSGVHGPVLSAVALLGADVPEVKTLEDLHTALLSEGIEAKCRFEEAPPTVVSGGNRDGSLRAFQGPSTAPVDAEGGSRRRKRKGMDTDERLEALAKQVDAQAAAFKEQQKTHADQLAAMKEQTEKAKAQADAADAKLKAAEDALKVLREANESERWARREADALHFVEKLATGKDARINPKQKALAAWFHARLDDVTEVVTAEQAKGMGLEEKGYTHLGLFAQLLDMAPAIGKVLHGGSAAAAGDVGTGDEIALEDAMALVAKDQGLSLQKYEEKAKVMAIVSRKYPHLAFRAPRPAA